MATITRPRAGVQHGVGAPRTWRGRVAAVLDGTLLLRTGLAVLFLVNALIAWIEPDEFKALVGEAGLGRFVDPELIVWGIRFNDVAVALALLLAWNRWPRLAQAWVGLYVLGVGLVKLAALV